MGGWAPRSEMLSIQESAGDQLRMSNNEEGHQTAGRTQNSEEGAEEPAGRAIDKRAPSNQKMHLLSTIHEGAEWPGWCRQPKGYRVSGRGL